LLQSITADTLRSESQEQKKRRKKAMESKNTFSGDDKPVKCT
jgi:hypothetical protein